MAKLTRILLIGVPLLIAVVIFALYFSLNLIIKHGVETIGPGATGADVKLRKANISLFSGKGQLKGFFIGNPEGFRTDGAFRLNEIRVALNVRSVFSDKIIIDEIFIDAPDITYEKGIKGDNIKTILNNIKKFSGGSGSRGEDGKGEKKLQINNFIVKNGRVNMSISALSGEKLTLPLPDIHLKDIGKEGEGSSLSKVMEEVFVEVNRNITIAVAGSATPVRGIADKAVEGLKGLFGK